MAIDGLGGLPNLSLEPHKRTPAVVRVAKDAGIKIKPSKASASEEQRAKMAVLAIINGAEGHIKKAKTKVWLRSRATVHRTDFQRVQDADRHLLWAPTCILTHQDAVACATHCFALLIRFVFPSLVGR